MSEQLSIAAAAALGSDERDALDPSQIAPTDHEFEQAAATWLWLCGVQPSDSDAARVRREVVLDHSLILALHLPALQLFRWFRTAEWEFFDSTERTGSEAWAMAALQRIWGACEGLGAMVSQCPVRPPC